MQSTLVYLASIPLRLLVSKRVYTVLTRLDLFLHAPCLSKPEGLNPAAITPFDCCSLSFQPFSHPVCARNANGTGSVFDLTNIIPWLK